MRDRLTIYYDELKDLFAIVNSKTNKLLDFGPATESKYSEILAFKSLATVTEEQLCLLPNEKLEDNLLFSTKTESKTSKFIKKSIF